MPEDGIEWVERSKILSFEEIKFLVNLFHKCGIRKFRFTGGEPTLRKDVVKLIKSIREISEDLQLSMTTNGMSLIDLAKPLKEAGLDRLNISLDTLDHKKFEEITRRDELDSVIAGIEAAIEAGFQNIKINAVSIKNFNSDIDSLEGFIDFSEQHNVEIRFIEYMPFTGTNWKNGEFISSKELRDSLSREEELVPLPMRDESQTSRVWSLRNGQAKFGFISSVSESFCASCDRIRITSEGILRPCLHANKEYPLKEKIRDGGSETEILEIIRQGLSEKWKEHPDFLSLNYLPPVNDREMIKLGG